MESLAEVAVDRETEARMPSLGYPPEMAGSRLLGLLCALILAGCGMGAEGPANVLLISLDSTRRDLLGAYGYRPQFGGTSSPNLDRLASEGVLMERAYATTSWTFPSHVSLLTGEPELVHAVDIDTHRPDPVRPFLAQLLSERGYRTAGFFSGPYLDPSFGFDRGFDRYEARFGQELEGASAAALQARRDLEEAERSGDPERLQSARQVESKAASRVEQASHRDRSSSNVTAAVIEEIDRAVSSGVPFFVFAHYFDPHYDYLPPAPYSKDFDPSYNGTLSGEHFFSDPAISVRVPAGPGDFDMPDRRQRVIGERDLQHVRAMYAAELAATDAHIGSILEALEEGGLTENTLVIVTADHGDEFFEHGGIGHRSTLFEEQVRVPLMLRLPSALPAGVRVEELVSTIDVVPTVLDLLRLPEPVGLGSRSFLPLVLSEEPATSAPRDAFGRLATNRRTKIELPGGEELTVLEVRLLETYHRGTLKLTRVVRWYRPLGAASPKALRRLQKLNEGKRREEAVRWIDLAIAPDESEASHSSDFTDPGALAALRAFNERYQKLLSRRGHADLAQATEDELAALAGLGYVGDAGRPVIASDEFTFPAPGHTLLEEGD